MTTATAGSVICADTLLLNVALVPPADVAAEAVELSAELRGHGGLFQLDSRTYFPHLTLYMARFPKADIDTISAVFRDICGDLNATELEHSGYFATDGGYYEISYTRSDEVLKLHKSVTIALHEFRHSPGDPATEGYFGAYTPEQRSNARRWGYDLANDLYRPHITLSRFKTKPNVTLLPRSGADMSFVANRVALFVADSMGAARELVTSTNLDASE